MWRRLIRISVTYFKNYPTNTRFWNGKRLKPSNYRISDENMIINEIFKIEDKKGSDNGFYKTQDNNDNQVLPEESISIIMEDLGMYEDDAVVKDEPQNEQIQLLEELQKDPIVSDAVLSIKSLFDTDKIEDYRKKDSRSYSKDRCYCYFPRRTEAIAYRGDSKYLSVD